MTDNHEKAPTTHYIGENRAPSGTRGHRDPAGHTLADLKELVVRSTRRGVHADRCRTCKAPVLVGLDEDRCAFRAIVDWTPLDPTGEFLALLAGRRTYTLDLQRSGNPKLTRRGVGAIAHGPVYAILRRDIVPQHRCGATLPNVDTRLGQTVIDPNQPCPF